MFIIINYYRIIKINFLNRRIKMSQQNIAHKQQKRKYQVFSHSSKHSTTNLTSNNKTIEKVFLKINKSDQQQSHHFNFKDQYLNRKSNNLRKDVKKHNLKNLEIHIKENTINKLNDKIWTSPIHSKKYSIESTDKILNNENTEVQLSNYHSNKIIVKNIFLNKDLNSYGIALNSNPGIKKYQQIKSGKVKTTIHKIIQEYSKLQRTQIPFTHKLIIGNQKHNKQFEYLDIKSILFDKKFYQFYNSNPHYIQNIRRQPAQFVKIFFNGITACGKFDLQALIRYYMIFVTKQANLKQKCKFLVNMIFQKDQINMQVEKYKSIVHELMKGCTILRKQILNKLQENMIKLTVKEKFLNKNSFINILFENQDLIDVCLTLLYIK